ncbi:hypothetical protein [Desulforhopalus singaporensis]|uniref:Uncharacterized protein n=1 Tax=Desulforhopalus singaporensis TaxID=91360 RepID=A0A1H0VUN3_9BACT|nr:hypothetical protein [Desulforhopalus singaporensis]SDP81918.1 hypothetical protein SAMN05660330_04237 [Desulforhopalus singaporensis]
MYILKRLILILSILVFSSCAMPKRGLINENTYYSSDSPSIKVEMVGYHKYIADKKNSSRYIFANNENRFVYIDHFNHIPYENKVDYYYEPSTWIFSHIPSDSKISTGTTEILGKTWYYCDSANLKDNGCALIHNIARFTYRHDIYYLQYVQVLPVYDCWEWRNTTQLSKKQKQTLSILHTNFENEIKFTSYLSDKQVDVSVDLKLSPAQQKSFNKYSDPILYPHLKAFAIQVDGNKSGWSYGYRKSEQAVETAIQSCRKKAANCRLYAVGDRIVINDDEKKLNNYLSEYYKEIFPTYNLNKIKTQALKGNEIRDFLFGRVGEGVESRTSNSFVLHFMDKDRLIVEITKAKTYKISGHYEGKWWVDNDRWCRKIPALFNGTTECHYVIKESNGAVFYNEDGALINRIKFKP